MTWKGLWDKITFIGIDDRDEFKYREVVLMNKLIFISTILMTGMIPVEVIINGWDLVWLEGVIILLCLSALYFNYRKMFTFAKFYFFIVASSVIFMLGLAIGKGSSNELFFIPTFIFPAMLFHDRRIIIAMSVVAFTLFVLEIYLLDIVPPAFIVKDEVKNTIRYIFIGIVFTIIFFEVYYFKKINYKYQGILAEKNAEIEHKKKEIIDSITYAKRIQEAILLPPDLVKNHLSDSFILFKPKDIVAGDFYWVTELMSEKKSEQKKSEKIIIAAVADCTGHGVPGAMVSVVCHNALNAAVGEYHLTEPAAILDKTRELVTAQFSKSSTDVKDGMDISLITIKNIDEKIFVQYAGANNPLWYIPKKSRILEEIKSDKQPVGKSAVSKPFTSHSLTLEKGDLIYIFSDGFADQFGGVRGKKYKYQPLKELLEKNQSLAMAAQQQSIEIEFENWKRDLEQVDDVCILGIRL
ncbi:MAG: SpoIIE family protein phosphatase [Crocinitomicaceae bacterium]|nr:SpoIIE family protein phosphatase [Crocinitomicaceae bacterium]MBK8927691.1 SpoIIE family protein phosphatase [Crocinitomicaceae bacterium]